MVELQSEKEFVSVSVENPVIHNTYDEGRYTTYDVILQTNSLSFTTKHSVVKRRYSDFQWLRRTLSRTTGGNIPSLPVGRRWFGTFDAGFLKERQRVLTEFLRKIVKDTLLISNTAFHLFMQTELNQREMDRLIKIPSSRVGGRSMNSLDNARATFGCGKPDISSRRSDAGLAAQIIGNRLGSSFMPCRSLPLLHGFNSGASPNQLASSLERDPVLSAHSPSESRGGKPEVVGSFSSDSTKHGNSLRRHVDEEEWKEWVILEDESKLPQHPKEPDDGPVPEDLKPKDYTNVKWHIGEVSPSCTPSGRPHIVGSSSSNSLRSLSIQQAKAVECEVERLISEDRLPHQPCCSQSLPAHAPAMTAIRYNPLSSSALSAASLEVSNEQVAVNSESSTDSGISASDANQNLPGILDESRLSSSFTTRCLNADGGEKDKQTRLEEKVLLKNSSAGELSSRDENKAVKVSLQDDGCGILAMKLGEEKHNSEDDAIVPTAPTDGNGKSSFQSSSGAICATASESQKSVHNKSPESNSSERTSLVSEPSR